MIGLPEILSVTRPVDGQAILRISLPLGSSAFAGHFPGQPILAGVIQIDWALRLAGEHLAPGLLTSRDFQIKFRRVIGPEVPLFLDMEMNAAKRQLSFEYRIGDILATAGRFKLEIAS